jgi:hypothetical protein
MEENPLSFSQKGTRSFLTSSGKMWVWQSMIMVYLAVAKSLPGQTSMIELLQGLPFVKP